MVRRGECNALRCCIVRRAVSLSGKRRHRQVKWLRTAGAFFDIADWETKPFTPEDLRDRFDEICDWDSETVFPDDEKADGTPSPQMQQILSKL